MFNHFGKSWAKVLFFYKGECMKKLLALGFFIATIGTHNVASGKIHRVDTWNAEKYLRYTHDIASRMEQNCLPEGDDLQEKIQKDVWKEVCRGQRSLLLLTSNDEAKEYRAHVYYVVEPAYNRVRIAAPGFIRNDQNIMIPVLATFFEALRTLQPLITFIFPQTRIPAYQGLIDFFGFIADDTMVTDEYVRQAEAMYGYTKEHYGELHGFVLPAEVEIKGKDMCAGVSSNE